MEAGKTVKNGWWKPVAVSLMLAFIGGVFAYGMWRGSKSECDRRQDENIIELKIDVRANEDDIEELKGEQRVTNEFLKLYKPQLYREAVENVKNGNHDTIP